MKYSIDQPVLSGAMSKTDITKPFDLLVWYNRALMTSCAWLQEESTVYLLCFGGGRIPMILLNYIPHLSVESTENDPNIIRLSKEYFGISDDERLSIVNEDSRIYL